MYDSQSALNWWKWAQIEHDGLIEVNYLRYQDGKYRRTNTEYWDKIPTIDSAWLRGQHLVAVGVNPRPIFDDPQSVTDCAKDKDILVYKNLFIDIEPIHAPNTNVTVEDRERCEEFLANFPCAPSNIVVADSGNGFHILIAIPAYDNPMEFGNKLQTWYKSRILPDTKKLREHYNVRIDFTFSPSRQVKLYGTRKPIEHARLSSFPNTPRVESETFKQYILSFKEKVIKKVTVGLNLGESTATLEAIEEKYGLVR